MAAVVVPNFIGPEKTMEWEVNVTEPTKKGEAKKK